MSTRNGGRGGVGSDRIVLEGLEFHGHHGVYAEEARLGARFSVDVELHLALPEHDALPPAVDYSRVYALVRDAVTGERFLLIEALAARLARGLLESEPAADAVTVRVHKPHAPLPGVVRDVFVEVVRRRADAPAE